MAPDDSDIHLLRGGEDAYAGVAIHPARIPAVHCSSSGSGGLESGPGGGMPMCPVLGAPADASELDRQRVQHAAAAELAVVALTAPRLTAIPLRSLTFPSYWRLGDAGCNRDTTTLRIVSRSDDAVGAAGSGDAGWLAHLVEACDAEPACRGFDTVTGRLLQHLDLASCPSAGAAPGSAADATGTFSKAVLSIAPQPYQLALPTGPGGSVETWFALADSDVYLNDIGTAPAAPGGDAAALLLHHATACRAAPACAGFHHPSAWLKSASDVSALQFGKGGVYVSRSPLPPLDYIVDTVVSLVREMTGGSEAQCGGNGSEASGGGGLSLRGRTHLYVYDTTAPALHESVGPQGTDAVWPSTYAPAAAPAPATPRVGFAAAAPAAGVAHLAARRDLRGPASADYWFGAFAYLRRRFARLPCVTFMPHGAYPRLEEAAPPTTGRGTPHWHADNRRKQMPRGKVQQTLDFAGALRHAAALSPRAHVMVWEDDCHACTGTLATLQAVISTLDGAGAAAARDARWGALKIGNGGSGLLFHAQVVSGLLAYLVTRRGSENVDVSMWRFVHSGGYSDYISRKSWSAHRGLYSSFQAPGQRPTQSWNRVHCTNELDYHWGWYKDCDPQRLQQQAVAAAGDTAVALRDVLAQWRCSVFSPATDGAMPR